MHQEKYLVNFEEPPYYSTDLYNVKGSVIPDAEALFPSGVFIFHIFKNKSHKNKFLKGIIKKKIIEVENYIAYFELEFPS